jgi:hypothetical protein
MHGQGGSQLVTCVVDEGALALQRLLQPGEHLVQGLAQPVQLVTAGGDREPPLGIGRRYLRSLAPDRLDGSQSGGDRRIADDAGQQKGHRPADQQQRRQAGQRVVAVVERGRDDDHELPSVGLGWGGEQAGVPVDPWHPSALDEDGAGGSAPPVGVGQNHEVARAQGGVDDPARRAEHLGHVPLPGR